MKKLKIGFYNPYLDTLGGGERYTLTLASHWSKTNDVFIFWDKRNISGKAQKHLNVDLSRIKVVQNMFRGKNVFEKLFKTNQYDLLFFLSDGSIPSTLARRNILHFQCPFPRMRTKTLLNRCKLSRCQAVVCNSWFTKQYIDMEYGVRSKVIYPPVDVAQWKQLDKKKAILSVGRFSTYFINKKQNEIVMAFKKFFLQRPDWQLWLAGGMLPQDRSYFEEVRRGARGLPVRLFPNIPFVQLQRLYGEALIYWHAAGFGESEQANPAGMEHFGIATVEAMAAGAVPIVYEGGGLPEIVTDGKNGFLWKTLDELLEKTNEVITKKHVVTALQKAAIETSKQFSVSRFCDAFDRLLYEI